ncbi:MAG: TIGR03546 family protein [Elusimicrobiota bacterium]
MRIRLFIGMPLLKPIRYLVKALVAQDSARQLAAGFAIGMAVGLIPKTSLLFHLGLVLLCMTQVNLAAGYCAAAVFGLASPVFDPLFHAIGALLLVKAAFLKPLWTALYNLPVVPWTAFNNTVVLGSSLVGAALAYPVYRLTVPVFEKYRQKVGAKLREMKVVQLLLGAQVAGKLGGGS